MSGDDERKPTPQEDLLTLLSNPDAMRLLAFGARTMSRMVDTGRDISKVASAITPGPFIPSPAARTSDSPKPDPKPPTDPAAETAPRSRESAPPPPSMVPEGSMLVPVEAWNRVLDQLGNIHQAGQALAEARERAARAEAVAEFQAERRMLAEAEAARLADETRRLAEELEASKAPPPPSPTTSSETPVEPGKVTRRGLVRGLSDWLRS